MPPLDRSKAAVEAPLTADAAGPASNERPRPLLVMLVGPPASGKSYLAHLLVERLDASLLQTDALRRAMFRPPRYTPREHAAVYAEAHRRIARQLRRAARLVFDATNLSERGRRRIYRIADEAGADLLILLAFAPPEVARARLAARASGADARDLSEADENVRARLGRAQPIGRPHLVVNTAVDLQQVLQMISRRVAAWPGEQHEQ